MSDIEIKEYLIQRNFIVDAQECLARILNTSHQIISSDYNYNTSMMTITTPENVFRFKWNLQKL